jgi:hypothetical protein
MEQASQFHGLEARATLTGSRGTGFQPVNPRGAKIRYSIYELQYLGSHGALRLFCHRSAFRRARLPLRVAGLCTAYQGEAFGKLDRFECEIDIKIGPIDEFER